MSTLEQLLANSKTTSEFATAYLKHVGELLARLDSQAIADIVVHLDQARRGGHTIFLIGNGGSAATASHMSNDLGLCISCQDGTAFRAFALTDGVPIMTAIANDFGYEEMFLRQLQIHYRDGDVLVAISASGNSPNVLAAVSWIRARGGVALGLLGFDGGKLKDMCNAAVLVRTPKGEYGPVEDIHMVLDHLITIWLRHSAGQGA